jgi:hypothetical protein
VLFSIIYNKLSFWILELFEIPKNQLKVLVDSLSIFMAIVLFRIGYKQYCKDLKQVIDLALDNSEICDD